MLLIRSLSKPEMGTWGLFLTVISIFEATKSGLLKNAHIRFVSASSDKKERTEIASSSLMINSAVTLLFIIFLWFCSDWLGLKLHAGHNLAVMLKCFIPGLLSMIFFSHLEAIQQSHLDFKGVFAGYLVRQLSFFVFIALHNFLHLPFTLGYLAIYQSISVLIGAVTLYFFSRKYLFHRFDVTKNSIKKIINYGSYIFGSNVMANIFSNVDQIMTASLIQTNSVTYAAYYNTASRINGLVDIPSYAAADILFPKSSRAAAEEGKKKVQYLYERMVGILLSFTTPAALFIIIFPKIIITIIAGAQYDDAAPILQLYMITGLMRPMQNQAANLLNSIGKPGLCFLINTIGLAVNLVVNYICLINFGFYGAAIGTLITCIVGSITWYFIMRKQIDLNMKNVIKYMMETYKIVYEYIINFLKTKKDDPEPPSTINFFEQQYENSSPDTNA
jgi:O-antigen/teichoic acid export membrane protein